MTRDLPTGMMQTLLEFFQAVFHPLGREMLAFFWFSRSLFLTEPRFLFQATTRCSSSLLEPRPSPSERWRPLATTSVNLYEIYQYFTAGRCSACNNHELCARTAIKNLRGEYYLNGHWVIEFTRATPIAGTMLYYQRGAEGKSVPETIIGRGPTTEPLIVEVPLNETFEENFGYAFNSLTNVYGGALARQSRTNSQFKIENYSRVFMWAIHFGG